MCDFEKNEVWLALLSLPSDVIKRLYKLTKAAETDESLSSNSD